MTEHTPARNDEMMHWLQLEHRSNRVGLPSAQIACPDVYFTSGTAAVCCQLLHRDLQLISGHAAGYTHLNVCDLQVVHIQCFLLSIPSRVVDEIEQEAARFLGEAALQEMQQFAHARNRANAARKY